MSAKMSPALGGSPHKFEAIAASNTDHRPTRWLVHRRKLRTVKITPAEASVFLTKTLQPLQLSGAMRLPAHCVHRAGASMPDRCHDDEFIG